MTPIPATISNNLVGRIIALDIAGAWSVDHSRELMFAARKLRGVNTAEGDMIIGMIHCMDGNIPAMRTAFKNAIAFAPGFYGAKANFGAALVKSGFFSEAIEYLLQAEVIAQKPLNYRMMSLACSCLGLESKARYFHGLSDFSAIDYGIVRKERADIKSKEQDEALAAVQESLIKDAEIWESLSKR